MKFLITIILLTLSLNSIADTVFSGPISKCEVSNKKYLPSTINFSVYTSGLFNLGPKINLLYTFQEFNLGDTDMSFISTLEKTDENKYSGKLTNVDHLVDVLIDLSSVESVTMNLTDKEEYVFSGKCTATKF